MIDKYSQSIIKIGHIFISEFCLIKIVESIDLAPK
jgi:hypothetical protein